MGRLGARIVGDIFDISQPGGSLMANNSSIEWTEATWNPVTGCDKVSPGCANCYAERMAGRLLAMGQANYANGFALTLQPHMLEAPLKWRKPQRIFVNSMSDLFHVDVPAAFVQSVFSVMGRASWHEYQVLTKRSDRLLELDRHLPWMQQIWMGVSVENLRFTDRIDHLRQTHAQVKFLSLEPLLGDDDIIWIHDYHLIPLADELRARGIGQREARRAHDGRLDVLRPARIAGRRRGRHELRAQPCKRVEQTDEHDSKRQIEERVEVGNLPGRARFQGGQRPREPRQ